MGTVGMILCWIGAIGGTVFWIQILIYAFKTSVGWGLGSLIIPIVGLVYVAKNWAECKTPFLRYLLCMVVMIVGMGLSFWGAMSSGMAGPGPG
jgi:hypothetical protein